MRERTLKEIETWRRIHLSVAAYAYEYLDDTIMSDEEYDRMSRQIDVSIDTDNEQMDKFFRTEFEPDTGMWIRKHPDKEGLKRIYMIKKNYANKQ